MNQATPKPRAPFPHADRIHTVTGDTFDTEVLRGQGPIAVEFMTYGCEHCRAMEPVLQTVAAELEGSETIFRVNLAVEADLAERYAIAGTPTLVMFSSGREVGRAEGPRPNVESVRALVTGPFA